MGRMLRNFKVRAAKFLLLNPHKYQNTGTATGRYKGPSISQRRMDYAKNPRKPLNFPLLDNVLGSPLTKGLPNEAYGAKMNDTVFVFRNTRTHQTLYSLTGHLDPESALPQLTFYGKKTIPSKYRKDDWRPFIALKLPSKQLALLCYWKLQDLRMLRDYAWREKGKNNPPWEVLKKRLLDHTGTSVCDVSTAVAKVMDPVISDHANQLVQWKAVEQLADEAKWGGLNILRKQISRAQRVLVSRKRNKKFQTPQSLESLKEFMQEWYETQAMMTKAVNAVNKVRALDDASQVHLTPETQAAYLKTMGITDPTAPTAAEWERAEEKRPFRNHLFTKTYGVNIETPLNQLTYKMAMQQVTANAAKARASDFALAKVTEATGKWREHVEQFARIKKARDLKGLEEQLAELQEMVEQPNNYKSLLSAGVNAPTSAKQDVLEDVKVFWSSIADRRYTNTWSPYVTHMSMGPRIGRDQYFSPYVQYFEENAHHWDEPTFSGNEDIDLEIAPKTPKKTKSVLSNLPFERSFSDVERDQALQTWQKVKDADNQGDQRDFLDTPYFKDVVEAEHVKQHYWAFLDDIKAQNRVRPNGLVKRQTAPMISEPVVPTENRV